MQAWLLCLGLPLLGGVVSAAPWWRFRTTIQPNGSSTFNSNSPFNQEVVNFILSASSNVKVMFAQTFSDQATADALNNRAAALGGSNVKIIRDDGANVTVTLSGSILQMTDAGGPAGEMHNKVIIVDGGTPNARVLVMTANMNDNAYSDQDNILLIINNAAIANQYNSEFDEMWSGMFKGGNSTDPGPFTINTGPHTATVRVMFTPEDNPMENNVSCTALSKTRAAIKNAAESVLWGIFTQGVGAVNTDCIFSTARQVEDEVQRWYNLNPTGRVFRGVFDDGQITAGLNKAYEDFNSNLLDVVRSGDPGIYHLKNMVMDQRKIVHGSANFTQAASDGNKDENQMIIDSPILARAFARTIMRSYSIGVNEAPAASPAPDNTAPPAVTGVSATSGGTDITVSWTASAAPDFSRYYVFIATRVNNLISGITAADWQAHIDKVEDVYPEAVITSVGTNIATLTTWNYGDPLVTGTTYFVCVVQTDKSVNESPVAAGSFNQVFFSGVVPPQPPNVPNTAATPVSLKNGSWTNDNTPTFTFDLSDPNPGDTVTVRFQIATNPGFSPVTVDSTPALGAQGTWNLTFGPLSDSASYYWRLHARDGGGSTSPWTPASSTFVFRVDATPPLPPTSVIASSGASPVELSWGGASDALSGVQSYSIYRATFNFITASDPGVSLIATGISTVTFNDPVPAVNTTYWYRIRSVDLAGNPSGLSVSDDAFVPDLPAPPNPPDTSATPAALKDGSWTNDNTPTFSFTITDPNAADLVTFEFQLAENTSFSPLTLSSQPALAAQGARTLPLGPLADSNAYYWRVRAWDSTDSTSTWVSATSTFVFRVDTTPPSAPGGVVAAEGAAPVEVFWDVATDAGSGVASYEIWRATYLFSAVTDPNVTLIVATATASPFNDNSALANTIYWYRIRAKDNATNIGPLSIADSAFTGGAAPPGTLLDLKIAQVGKDINGGVAGTPDFFMLFNPTQDPIRIRTGTDFYIKLWEVTSTNDTPGKPLTAVTSVEVIPPNGFYLIATANPLTDGAGFSMTPDATITDAAFAGGVVLSTDSATFGVAVFDRVGWSTAAANALEGSPTTMPDGSSTIQRKAGHPNGHCVDTQNNSSDFVLAGLSFVHNASSPTEACAPPGPPTIPEVLYPNGGEVFLTGSSTFTIRWLQSSDPDGDPITYELQFTTNALAASPNWRDINLTITTTFYTWNPVVDEPTTQAKVRVRAKSGAAPDFSAYDESNSVFTIAKASFPPNPPSNLGPAALVSRGWVKTATPTFTFDITDPNSNDQVRFVLMIDNDSNFSSPVYVTTSGLQAQGSKSFALPVALAEGSYHWRVKAIDAGGLESAWTDAAGNPFDFGVDLTAPSAPPGLAAWVNFSVIETSWSASSDGTGSGIRFYHIYRKTAAGVTYADLYVSNLPGTTLNYTDANVTNTNTYFYRVAAEDWAGNISALSVERSTRTTVPPGSACAASASVWDLKISQVSPQAVTGAASDEFIELYNPMEAPITIHDGTNWLIRFWVVEGGGATDPQRIGGAAGPPFIGPASIPPRGHFLLATSNPYYGRPANATFSATMTSAHGGIILSTRTADNKTWNDLKDTMVPIDKVGWGPMPNPAVEGQPATQAELDGVSLERKCHAEALQGTLLPGGSHGDHGNGWDTDDNSQDFVVQQGTVTPENDTAVEPAGANGSPLLTDLNQYKTLGSSVIAIGGTTNENGVLFQARVFDPEKRRVKIQVEVKPVGTAFTNVPSASSTWADHGTTASVIVSGLTANTAYHWQMRGWDENLMCSAWVSFGGNPETAADFNTGGALNQLPTVSGLGPANLISGNWINDKKPQFQFTLGDPDGTQARFHIQVDDDKNFSQTKEVDFEDPVLGALGSRAWMPSFNLPDRAQYHWRVKAIDASGAASAWVEAVPNGVDFRLDATPPSIPGNFTARQTGKGAGLDWDNATDNMSGVKHYRVYRTTIPPGMQDSLNDFNAELYLIAITSFSVYSDPNLAPNTSYYYSVAAQDVAGNRSSLATPQTVYITPSGEGDVYDLKISQVVHGMTGAGGSDQEYIEIYNPSGFPVKIYDPTIPASGPESWRQKFLIKFIARGTGGTPETKELTPVTFSTTTSVFIPAHGFLLMKSNAGGWAADITFANGQLSDKDGFVLADRFEFPIDALGWGTKQLPIEPAPPWPAFEGTPLQSTAAVAAGDSMERKAKAGSTSASMLPGGADELAGNAYDTHNNANDFVIHAANQSVPQNMASAPEPANGAAPPAPTALQQFNSSGTVIPAGGSTLGDAIVIFEGFVDDSVPKDQVRLEVEIKPTAAAWPPSFTPMYVSEFVNPGRTVRIQISTGPGAYDWRARTQDSRQAAGSISGLQEFGGGAAGDDFVVPPNAAPTISALKQFDLETTLELPPGATTYTNAIRFQASVSDPNPNDLVQLEVRYKKVGAVAWTTAPPTGLTSPGVLTLQVYGLEISTSSDYEWEARALDDKGNASAWTAFSGAGGPDFRVRSKELQFPIKISEVMISSATLTAEFVELYNPTTNQIDIGAIPLVLHFYSGGVDQKVLTLTGKMNAYSYLLIGSQEYANSISTAHPITVRPDFIYTPPPSIGPDNAVYISTSEAAVVSLKIDLVGWGTVPSSFTETSPAGTPSAGGSLIRKATATATAAAMQPGGAWYLSGNGWDTNNNASDFVLSAQAFPDNSKAPPRPYINLPPTVTNLRPPNLLNGSWTNDPRPSFLFQVGDPNGTSELVGVQLEIDDTLDFSSPVHSTTTEPMTIEPPFDERSYMPPTPLSDGTYNWRVRAFDTGGAIGTWVAASAGVAFGVDTTKPTPPSGVSASVDRLNIFVDWTASSDGGSGVKNYFVYRATADLGPDPNNWLLLATQLSDDGAPGYYDSVPVLGAAYYYKVSAMDNAGNQSNLSAPAVSVFIPSATATTVFYYPKSFRGDHTGTDALSDLQANDYSGPSPSTKTMAAGDLTYTIQAGRVLAVDDWVSTQPAAGVVNDVKFQAEYSLQSGFTGSNQVRRALEGQTLASFTPSLLPSGGEPDNTFQERSLVSLSTDLVKILDLDVEYTNNSANNYTASFDYWRIAVQYEPRLPVLFGVAPSGGPKNATLILAVSGQYLSEISSVTASDGLSTWFLSDFEMKNSGLLQVTIPANFLPKGNYTLRVRNGSGWSAPPGPAFSITDPTGFSKPRVFSITPSRGSNGTDVPVTITGVGFTGYVQARLLSTPNHLLSGVPVVTDTRITGLVVPAGGPAGDWDVVVTAGGGESDPTVDRVRYTIEQALPAGAAPRVTNADTGGVCANNSVETPITINGENLQGVTTNQAWLAPSTAPLTQVAVLVGTPTVNAFGTSITGFKVPKGVPVGLYAVIVRNGNGLTNPAEGTVSVCEDIPLTNHIVVSEIYADPISALTNEQGEWIELYNPTTWPWTLNGWSITSYPGGLAPSGSEGVIATISGPDPLVIQPYSFFLIADSGYASSQEKLNRGWPDADYTAGDFQLVHQPTANAWLILKDNNGNVVDKVGWSLSAKHFEAAPAPTAGEQQSLERKAFDSSNGGSMGPGGLDEFMGNSLDTDNNQNDFTLQTSPRPQNRFSKPEKPSRLRLSDPQVSPTCAQAGSPVTFSVKYRHMDNVAPDVARILIDGKPFNMTPGAGSPWPLGQIYTYTTSTLTAGFHTYEFFFQKGSDSAELGDFTAQIGDEFSNLNAFSAGQGGPNAFNPVDGSTVPVAPVITLSALAKPLVCTLQIELWFSTTTSPLTPPVAFSETAPQWRKVLPSGSINTSGSTLFSFDLSSGTHFAANRMFWYFVRAKDSNDTVWTYEDGAATINPSTGVAQGNPKTPGAFHRFFIDPKGIGPLTIQDIRLAKKQKDSGLWDLDWRRGWPQVQELDPVLGSNSNRIYNDEDTAVSFILSSGTQQVARLYYLVDSSTRDISASEVLTNSSYYFLPTVSPNAAGGFTYQFLIQHWYNWAGAHFFLVPTVVGAPVSSSTYLVYHVNAVKKMPDWPYKATPEGDRDGVILYGQGDGKTPGSQNAGNTPYLSPTDYSPVRHAQDEFLRPGSASRYFVASSTDRWRMQNGFMVSGPAPNDGVLDFFPGGKFEIYLRTAYQDSQDRAAPGEVELSVNTTRDPANFNPPLSSPTPLTLAQEVKDGDPALGPEVLFPSVNNKANGSSLYVSTSLYISGGAPLGILKFSWFKTSSHPSILPSTGGATGVQEGQEIKYLFRIRDAQPDDTGKKPWAYVYNVVASAAQPGRSGVTTDPAFAILRPFRFFVLQDDQTKPFAFKPKGFPFSGTYLQPQQPSAEWSNSPAWPSRDPSVPLNLSPTEPAYQTNPTHVIGTSLAQIRVSVGLADTANGTFTGAQIFTATAAAVWRTAGPGAWPTGGGVAWQTNVEAKNTDPDVATADSGIVAVDSDGNPLDNRVIGSINPGTPNTNARRLRFSHYVAVFYVYMSSPPNTAGVWIDPDGTPVASLANSNLQGIFLPDIEQDGADATDRPDMDNNAWLPDNPDPTKPGPLQSVPGKPWRMQVGWVQMTPAPPAGGSPAHDPVTRNGVWTAMIPPPENAEITPFLYYRIWASNNDNDPQAITAEAPAGAKWNGGTGPGDAPVPAVHGWNSGVNDPYGDTHSNSHTMDGRVHDRDYGWVTPTIFGGIVSPGLPRVKVVATVSIGGVTRQMITYLRVNPQTRRVENVISTVVGPPTE